VLVEEAQLSAACAFASSSSMRLLNRRESTFTGSRYLGRAATQRLPSCDRPPPGTIMFTCRWCVIVEPQVCSTEVIPILAPSRLGSAAILDVAARSQVWPDWLTSSCYVRSTCASSDITRSATLYFREEAADVEVTMASK
jgi:hypothetical protein